MKQIFQADRCLVCHEEIAVKVSWVQLFSKETNTTLCDACKKKLIQISGEKCRICGRSFEQGAYSYRSGDLCFDCIRWEGDPDWCGLLELNMSLFLYNDFLKETLATFKFRGDYVIASAFADFVKLKLKQVKVDQFVPIPLSEERLYERGFNQAEALIKEAGFRPSHLLARIHTEKQSKKSRSERIHLPQVFRMSEETTALTGQRILLVDDIYTTGSTLRHAARVLKQAGAASVSSLTLARG